MAHVTSTTAYPPDPPAPVCRTEGPAHSDMTIWPACGISPTTNCRLDRDQPIHAQSIPAGDTVTRSDAWIAGRAIAGRPIKNGAAIGAGAVVTRKVPPFAIMTDVPTLITGQRKAPGLTRNQTARIISDKEAAGT